MSNRKFLQVKGLKRTFGSGDTRQEVLKGIDFSVAKGEFCVLLGPSGSGKSTLLNILGGIDSADSGEIIIDGDRLEDLGEKALTNYRRKHLGYVFQMSDFSSTATSCRISFRAVSSREFPSAELSSKTPISCSATSQQAHSTTRPRRRYCSL